MNDTHEKYMKRCYELAISAGRKGYDTFGAVLVNEDKIIAEAENTADYEKGIFGHAEFNLVHKCANKFPDTASCRIHWDRPPIRSYNSSSSAVRQR